MSVLSAIELQYLPGRNRFEWRWQDRAVHLYTFCIWLANLGEGETDPD